MQSAGRLNPFEFRAGLKQADTAGLIKSLSLNPFEFRAGLKHWRPWRLSSAVSLNPFEFRAGLKPDPHNGYATVKRS